MSRRSAGRPGAASGGGWMAALSFVGDLVKGVDVDVAADRLEQVVRSKGGDPVRIWLQVYQVAGRRIAEAHLEQSCKGQGYPCRHDGICSNCGGAFPRPSPE